jgi:hypothetical protein
MATERLLENPIQQNLRRAICRFFPRSDFAIGSLTIAVDGNRRRFLICLSCSGRFTSLCDRTDFGEEDSPVPDGVLCFVLLCSAFCSAPPETNNLTTLKQSATQDSGDHTANELAGRSALDAGWIAGSQDKVMRGKVNQQVNTLLSLDRRGLSQRAERGKEDCEGKKRLSLPSNADTAHTRASLHLICRDRKDRKAGELKRVLNLSHSCCQ